MNMHDGNPFRRLWMLGYHRLCPVTPPGCPVSERSGFHRRIAAGDDARGKAPGIRWSDGNWSGMDFVAHESLEPDLDKWHAMGAGVGIKTGQGLVLIDADTKNEAIAATIKKTIEATLGTLPVRIGQYPKAGYVVRVDGDFRYARIEFGERDAKGRLQERVEILSEGRQFVAFGIHPKTLLPYRWPTPLPPLDELPAVTPEQLTGLLAALRPLLPAASEIVREGAQTDVDQASLLGDRELLAKAVRATPNTSDAFPTRESYRDYGYAIKAAFGPEHDAEAFELYADWCARWQDGDNQADVVAADWSRMKPPFRRGASWIYELAERHGGGAFNRAEQWFDSAAANPEAPLFPENLPNAFEKAKRFDLVTLDHAAATFLTGSAAPLIKGLLDQGAMTVGYGESNSGKTFVFMDMAYHVARGLTWGGMKVTRAPVVYIAAEGGQGARKRAAALVSKYGEAGDAFRFLLHPVNLLRADADLGPLVAALKELPERPGLIVLDTLSRAMAGGDENASTDMGAMVKHLDVVRAATSAHLLIVHHTGKDRAKGARGHSLLRAATDTEIEVGGLEIVVTKQRDLDGTFSTGFALDVVTLGVDRDGDPITSCTIRLVRREDVAVGVATHAEDKIVRAVSELEAFNEGEKDGVSVDEIVEFFADSADNMSVNSVRHTLKRLVAKCLLTKCLRGRWKVQVSEVANEVAAAAFQ